jgi:RNA polymerase sigma factor (sigma-70 family)
MKDNARLIKKIAWSFYSYHYSLGVEWDDLLQEANIAYIEALEKYDKDKGKISTFVWHCINNRLHNFLKEQEKYKAHKWQEEICRLDDIEETQHPSDHSNEFWEALTDEAKIIAHMILFTPRKYIYLTSTEAEGRIMRIMSKMGWSEEKIYMAITNLKTVCKAS